MLGKHIYGRCTSDQVTHKVYLRAHATLVEDDLLVAVPTKIDIPVSRDEWNLYYEQINTFDWVHCIWSWELLVEMVQEHTKLAKMQDLWSILGVITAVKFSDWWGENSDECDIQRCWPESYQWRSPGPRHLSHQPELRQMLANISMEVGMRQAKSYSLLETCPYQYHHRKPEESSCLLRMCIYSVSHTEINLRRRGWGRKNIYNSEYK